MPTIQEFIQFEVGKPNKSTKHLILEAYALGVSHGEGEDYQPTSEEEEPIIEKEDNTEISDSTEQEESETMTIPHR
jgi:hypothetical protein